MTVRSGIAAGSIGTTSASGSRERTKPPTWMERWRGSSWRPRTTSAQHPDAVVGGVEAGVSRVGNGLAESLVTRDS